MPEFVPAPTNFDQVAETYVVYDTAKIFGDAKDAPIEYASYAALAVPEDGIPFISARTNSDIGNTYTNITSRDNLQKFLQLESMGIQFHAPNPVIEVGSGLADISKAKIFMEEIAHHSYLQFLTEEDVRCWLKPQMAPPGYGQYGFFQLVPIVPAAFLQGVNSSGLPQSGNRWKWINGLNIPATTKITVKLKFSDHGKALLTKMGDVGSWDFFDVPLKGMAKIEVSLRGKLAFQTRGQYRNPGSPTG